MFNLSWDVEELKMICSEGCVIRGDIQACIELRTADLQPCNVPNKVATIQSWMLQFLKRVGHLKRVPAMQSHLCVYD